MGTFWAVFGIVLTSSVTFLVIVLLLVAGFQGLWNYMKRRKKKQLKEQQFEWQETFQKLLHLPENPLRAKKDSTNECGVNLLANAFNTFTKPANEDPPINIDAVNIQPRRRSFEADEEIYPPTRTDSPLTSRLRKARLDHKSAKVIGTLHLSLQYNSETTELSLTIIQAALMKPEIPDNVILEIYLRPHTQEALRANVYMDTGEPQETKFTFNIAPDPLRDQRFRCCVKTVDSEGKASENDLGTVTLHFSSIMGNLCRGLEIMLRKDVLAEPPPQAIVKEESEETKTGKKVQWREDTKDSEVTTDEKEETEPEDSTFNMGGLAGMLFAGIQGVANVVPKEDKTPSLLISLEYQKQTEKLIIGVIKAKNLKPVEPTRRVDPMVKVVIIMSARILKKKKTNFRKRDLHPVFNENLSFVIPQRLLSRISVILKVVDNIKGYSLGNAMIGSNSMDEELDHWTAMCESNKPIARWHKLDDL